MSYSIKQFGFSLIEVIVAMAVIAVLAASGASSYRAWIQNTQIRTAAESLQSGLSRARAEALKRNTPVRFTLGANSAWTVQCVTPANCADLAAGLIESRPNTDGSSADIAVTATPGGATDVVFTNLGVKSNAAGQLTQVAVDFTGMDAAESRDLNVTIGAGGNVRMCDPSTGVADPRRC
ncbi:MAG: GspH/FimT family pseudopilin [Methylophilaceae bacterium]